jgi:two-component system phosphate regulon response regulator PhoB
MLRNCRRLRQASNCRSAVIIVLLDEGLEHLQLQFLQAGANHCVSRPSTDRELATRIRSLICRPAKQVEQIRDTPELAIDISAMRIVVHDEEIPVTTLEFRLLEFLARHEGRVLSRDTLLDAVWGEMRFVTPRTVDACIRRLRKKIEAGRSGPAMLNTLRGVGYRLDARIRWQVAPPNESCNCKVCAGIESPGRSVRFTEPSRLPAWPGASQTRTAEAARLRAKHS